MYIYYNNHNNNKYTYNITAEGLESSATRAWRNIGKV